MPSPLYSGAAAIMLGTMTERPDLGWSYFEKLKAADAVAVRGNGAVVTAVANGEKTYGVLVDFMAFNAKAKGSPIDFIFPAEGNPAVTEPVAILKTSQNQAAARAFVDFILSDEGQKLAVAMGYIPARASVGMPSWYPAGAKIKLMPTDIAERGAIEQREPQAVRATVRQLTPQQDARVDRRRARASGSSPTRSCGGSSPSCSCSRALPLARLSLEASRPRPPVDGRASRASSPTPSTWTATRHSLVTAFGGTALAVVHRHGRRAGGVAHRHPRAATRSCSASSRRSCLRRRWWRWRGCRRSGRRAHCSRCSASRPPLGHAQSALFGGRHHARARRAVLAARVPDVARGTAQPAAGTDRRRARRRCAAGSRAAHDRAAADDAAAPGGRRAVLSSPVSATSAFRRSSAFPATTSCCPRSSTSASRAWARACCRRSRCCRCVIGDIALGGHRGAGRAHAAPRFPHHAPPR